MRKVNKRLLTGSGSVYGAKLLFQWRVVDGGKPKRRKLCEERVVLLRARSPRHALAQAKRYGKAQSYKDPQVRPGGREVFFEFVGVIDMDDLLIDFSDYPTEVWYELRERDLPMERKQKLLVPENRMRAVFIPQRRRGRVTV